MQAISRKLLPVSTRLCHQFISPSFVRPNSTSLLSLNPYLRPSQDRVNTLGIPRQPACFTMTTQVTPSATAAEQPWYAAYPEAQSKPDPISRSKVLELLHHGKDDEKFVLVDLRRTDYEVRPCGPVESAFPGAWILTRVVGRHHQGLHQPACSKPVPNDSLAVRSLQGCWRPPCHLVLW